MPRKSYRVRFPGGSGDELAGIVDLPESLDGFPVAVFSHCFTCNKDLKAIVRVSRGLADAGIAVLRYDMTGLGGSDGDFSRTSFTTNVADLRMAVRFAEQELGPVDTLIGHSFGGAASLFAAGDSPSQSIQSVVALAAPSDTQHLAELLSRMNPKIESEGEGTVSIGGREWLIRQEMLDDFRSHDLPSQIVRSQTPTLLLHSPSDRTVLFDHALRIMGLIQNSPLATPVSLVSLAGADHLLSSSEADREFVIATVSAFVHRFRSPTAHQDE
ncbi:MAG: alpha/beta hydrolase family protein [Rubripirellula sp.]